MLKAVAFKDIREKGDVVEEFLIPATLDEAYKIQKTNSQNVKGWKLGGTTSFTRKLFDTNEVYYGGVDGKYIFTASEEINVPNFIRVPSGESEVTFRLKNNVEKLSMLDIKTIDMAELIESVMPSIEFPWSAFPLPGCGLNVLVADTCAAGFLVTGEELAWSKQVEQLLIGEVAVYSNRQLLTTGSVGNIIGGPVEALRSFLSLAQEHGIELTEGDVVATGGCTECLPIPLGEQISVNFENLGSLEFKLIV